MTSSFGRMSLAIKNLEITHATRTDKINESGLCGNIAEYWTSMEKLDWEVAMSSSPFCGPNNEALSTAGVRTGWRPILSWRAAKYCDKAEWMVRQLREWLTRAEAVEQKELARRARLHVPSKGTLRSGAGGRGSRIGSMDR